jgi:hypothetical protein
MALARDCLSHGLESGGGELKGEDGQGQRGNDEAAVFVLGLLRKASLSMRSRPNTAMSGRPEFNRQGELIGATRILGPGRLGFGSSSARLGTVEAAVIQVTRVPRNSGRAHAAGSSRESRFHSHGALVSNGGVPLPCRGPARVDQH